MSRNKFTPAIIAAVEQLLSLYKEPRLDSPITCPLCIACGLGTPGGMDCNRCPHIAIDNRPCEWIGVSHAKDLQRYGPKGPLDEHIRKQHIQRLTRWLSDMVPIPIDLMHVLEQLDDVICPSCTSEVAQVVRCLDTEVHFHCMACDHQFTMERRDV